MFQHFSTYARKHAALITLSVIGIILIALFHEIMKPFIIALIVVYLIDPFVALVNRIHFKGHHLPRGIAVICAYIIFLGAVTGVCLGLIPSLTKEISAATEAMPQYYNQIKDEELPKWSQKLDEIVFKLSRKSRTDIESSVNLTSQTVQEAFNNALVDTSKLEIPAIDTTGAQPLLRAERIVAPKPADAPKAPEIAPQNPVLFTIHPAKDGAFEFRQGAEEILIESNEKGSFIIKSKPKDKTENQASLFNLERELTKTLTEFVESSTKYIGSALSFLQYLIEFIIDTFIQVILVFMLAAFISIDTPKMMTSIRALFEDANGKATQFDLYKEKLSKALSGVIRGQMIICLINGTLTGIGLFIFGVDYALLLGIVAGVLSIVPVFGTIISTIPCVLLALMDGFWQGVGILIWILAVHFVDTNFFTPKIIGASANMHPAIIIFAILAGQYCAGALGLILALPFTAVLMTTVKFFLDQAKQQKTEPESDPNPPETSSNDVTNATSQPALSTSQPALTSPAENDVSEDTNSSNSSTLSQQRVKRPTEDGMTASSPAENESNLPPHSNPQQT